jgi:peptide/nickel transport system permease protein
LKRFLAIRLLNAVIVLFLVATVVFFLDRVTGNPVAVLLPPDATVADAHQLEKSLGLGAPLVVQYWHFMVGLFHLNLGQSLYYRSSVVSLIAQRFPATAELAGAAMVFALLVAIPAGIVAAARRGTALDTGLMSLVLLGQCAPAFFLGIILILLFSIVFPVFPSSGIGGINHLVLPAITLGAYSMAVIGRLLRSSLIDVFGEDYVRTARAKGLSGSGVIVKHALRNAALPVATVIGLEVGSLLGGAVVTETVFAWPGLGQLTVLAIDNRDYPLVQGIVLFFVTIFLVVNLVVDLTYAVIDPRIRYSAWLS